MITYNHEKFIAQAIESVLMQETDFQVELIIGEDCSTDGTRQIVKAYAEQYPNVIRALFPERNLGMQCNFVAVLEASRGDYVALLEGDDYWTSPQKLQRQADYMAADPEMALCHHIVNYVRWVDESRIVLYSFPPLSDWGIRQAKDLLGHNFIQTCSIMFRKSYLPVLDAGFKRLKIGDWALCYLVTEHGKIGFLDSLMADYRIHGSNTWFALGNDTKSFETIRAALYLAARAHPNASQTWHDFVQKRMDEFLYSQPTFFKASSKILILWQSGYLPLPKALRWVAAELKKRMTAECTRHPRAMRALKRIINLLRLRSKVGVQGTAK